MDHQILDLGIIESPQQFHQLGIFVLDGSGSMKSSGRNNISKADEVNIAVRELLTRFKASRIRKNFSFCVVNFDTSASLKTPVTEADSIDDNDNYDPLVGHGKGTLVYKGLEIAKQEAENFLQNAPQGGVPHSVIILVMTDGLCHKPQESLQFAEGIKTGPFTGQVTICTTYFGEIGKSDLAAKDFLMDMATDRIMGFKEVYDAETLRTFFEKSISAASGANID
ncbi:MAG: vWA domain-containing protein [Bacteroidota bacterium]